MREQTLGTHVARGAQVRRREATYAEGVARKANFKRALGIIVVIVIVLAIAIGAGVMAFRGVLGSEMSLKNSNANQALVAAKSNEPVYVLISAEIGAVAKPLDNDGPDIFMLARLDKDKNSIALINVPSTLQITVDNQSSSLSSLAAKGDAAVIDALITSLKVNINHYVKIDEAGIVGLVDGLNGVEATLDQAIDDPHAGHLYLEAGKQVLRGDAALVYLRATNTKMGETDRMNRQLDFATLILEKVFAKEGNFATRLESFSKFFQTDMALADLESVNTWLKGVKADDIICTTLPGYTTEVTDVSGSNGGRFLASSSDVQELFKALDEGRDVKEVGTANVATESPGSFTVEVQNGTSISGAASVTGDALRSRGFNVTAVGNASQPIYDETLVVYKGDNGTSRAKTVIDALGVGRAVSAGAYYTFDADVLVIIGADYKPVS